MTLRRALYMSRNIIAIKLGMELGEDAVISEATKFGITTRVPPYPSIHIGSADVIPLEMIAAYTTFANLGTRTIPNAILRVEDRTGKIVWQPQVRSVSVMDTAHAWLMTDALRDVVRHGTAVGLGRLADQLPGRRQDRHHQRRLRRLVHRVHARPGDRRLDRLRPAEEDQGQRAGRGARGAGLDRDDARGVRAPGAFPAAWPRPDGLTALDIDKTTGYKATPFCPKDVHYIESFIPGTEPTAFCPIHSPFGAVGGTGPMGGTDRHGAGRRAAAHGAAAARRGAAGVARAGEPAAAPRPSGTSTPE